MISVWKDFDRKKNADNVMHNQVIHCHDLAHRLHSFHKKILTNNCGNGNVSLLGLPHSTRKGMK